MLTPQMIHDFSNRYKQLHNIELTQKQAKEKALQCFSIYALLLGHSSIFSTIPDYQE